jgi:hypothetical protein
MSYCEVAVDLAEQSSLEHPNLFVHDIRVYAVAAVLVPEDGIRLLPGFRTDVTGLTRDEAQALFVLTTGGAQADLGLAGDAAVSRRVLLSFGGDVVVTSPPEVRDDLRETAAAAVAPYRARSLSSPPGRAVIARPPGDFPSVRLDQLSSPSVRPGQTGHFGTESGRN